MRRAMVAPGPNDIFLVGDAHQRIYAHQVVLGRLGINTRGGLPPADAELPYDAGNPQQCARPGAR
ncbi:hypothetical protein GCM10017688_36770 [Streptomyces ramulosus]